MIEISGLCKTFGNLAAVDDLSFSVQPGEILGFLGPNGAGKSTCMKMLTGFLTPDKGSIEIFSRNYSSDSHEIKSMLGYLPEGAPSYGDMSVVSFLQFIAAVRGFGRNSERVKRTIAQLQLEFVAEQKIDTLSKGFKRRVGLAQAILHDPKVLILDEPTDGLDPNQKFQVRELIRNLSRDKIVIISTHILEEVSAVCSRAIIIKSGQLVADGTPTQLCSQSRYHGAVTISLRTESEGPRPSEKEVVDKIQALEGVDIVEIDCERKHTYTAIAAEGKDIYGSIQTLLGEQKWPLQELHVEPGRLDDVFRRLTAEDAR